MIRIGHIRRRRDWRNSCDIHGCRGDRLIDLSLAMLIGR